MSEEEGVRVVVGTDWIGLLGDRENREEKQLLVWKTAVCSCELGCLAGSVWRRNWEEWVEVRGCVHVSSV